MIIVRRQSAPRTGRGRSAWRAFAAALSLAGLVAASDTRAATVSLHQDFVTATIARRLFTDNGRRMLTGSVASCNYVYIANPKATLRDGRLYIRMNLAGHAGISARGSCVGAGDQFATTISGRPVVNGDAIEMREFRIEEGKEMYRGLLEPLLRQQVPELLGLNLRNELTKMFQTNAAEARVSVTQFQLLEVTTRDGLLAVRFDFSLLANVP